jgi:hypothetical protein
MVSINWGSYCLVFEEKIVKRFVFYGFLLPEETTDMFRNFGKKLALLATW